MLDLEFAGRFKLAVETGPLNWLLSYSVAVNPDKMNLCEPDQAVVCL